jgi:hypothetical protein
MNNDDDLVLPDRLRALGRHPIEPAVQSRHLAALANFRQRSRGRIAFRLQMAAALVIGLLAVSSGLAVAEVDAGPISAVGKKLVGVVGVDIKDAKVTHGTERHYGAECLQVEAGKGARNRGQYLKWVREHHPDMLAAAKASNCGKPVKSGTNPDDGPD